MIINLGTQCSLYLYIIDMVFCDWCMIKVVSMINISENNIIWMITTVIKRKIIMKNLYSSLYISHGLESRKSTSQK